MNIKIEFRYAVLTSLVVLLWLIIEFAIGLQDTYLEIYPYVSLVMMIVIPFITYRLALIEKLEQKFGKLSFGQAFFSCLLITIFSCILVVPVQVGFHKLINPDFFETMIIYASRSTKLTVEQVAIYLNLKTWIQETVLFSFVIGTVTSLILALRMRTVK